MDSALCLNGYTNREWSYYKQKTIEMKQKYLQSDDESSILFAQAFSSQVIKYLWKNIDTNNRWDCRHYPCNFIELNIELISAAKEIGTYLSSISVIECGYNLGTLYTLLLPQKYKSDFGVYYTPPSLAERLLDVITARGIDWARHSILDPSCGGGAFLVTVANRMMGDYRIKMLASEERLKHIETHLSGIEIDGFAGWITQVLLDIITYQDAVKANRRIKPVIINEDTIDYARKETDKYDLIVGNPPYNKVSLNTELRNAYERSLYGHANLYGLFIDAALRMKSEDGLVGFVTPTSFLGGQYFSKLRKLLFNEAPLLDIDFVSHRTGVFDEVLQETCLAVFGRNDRKDVLANKINVEDKGYTVEKIGSFVVNNGGEPWIIPRELAQAKIIIDMSKDTTSIKDYGYKVSTGPLVWNRLKTQSRKNRVKGVYPIIWAEAISSEGIFQFNYLYRKSKKYFKLKDEQRFMLNRKSVVLVQRTTSKDQNRRLITCVLPQSFIDEWDGVVIENHVNYIHSVSEPLISIETLSLILNSNIVDNIFRCISGSVAVSAAELHALPLPPLFKVKEIDLFVKNNMINDDSKDLIEDMIREAYGVVR